MRLDAVKAEADRKARQKQGEIGLPAFNEYDPTKPLTAKYDEEDEPYTDSHPSRRLNNFSNSQATGYTPAPTSASAMNPYYSAPSVAPLGTVAAAVGSAYSPQPQTYTQQSSMQHTTYGNVANQPGHEQYPSTNVYSRNQQPPNTQYDAAFGQPQYPPNEYNQGQRAPAESTYGQGQYLSADQGGAPFSHHAQAASYYSTASNYPQPSHNLEASSYVAGGYTPQNDATHNSPSPLINYSGNPQQQQTFPGEFLASTAALSMGRDDYTFSRNPQPLHTSPPPLNITPNSPRQTSGPRGPRSPTSPSAHSQQTHVDILPGYEGVSQGAMWPREKR